MSDLVKRDDCDEKHESLERDVKRSIREAVAGAEARLKIWVLASILAMFFSVGGSLICTSAEFGTYKERIDNNTRQVESLDRALDKIRELLQRERRVP